MVLKDTKEHIKAVKTVTRWLAVKMIIQASEHDYTKLDFFDEFFDALSTNFKGEKFKENSWWEKHLKERHHLNDSVPKDVTLIDVMEMVVDCVCAGKARSGDVYPIKIDSDILQKALKNTVELLKKNIEVEK